MDDRTKKVSVIMPAYNTEQSIEKAIRSVVAQSYKNIEVIIVDDGSQDKTGIIADALSKEDNRIRVFHIKNGGVSNARNFAIAKCSGEYVAFIDSDDKMYPDMLSKMVKAMSENVDLVCAGFMVVSQFGMDLFSQQPFNRRLDRDHYDEAIAELQDKKALNSLWNKLFRYSIIQMNKLEMDPAVKMGEDLLFIIDYISCIKKDINCISDIVYGYTLSPQGAQATIKSKDAIRKRIDQLYRFEPWYEENGYKKDSMYAEQLRCIYTSLIEASNISYILDIMYSDERNQRMLSIYRPQNKKFKLFAGLLRTHKKILIYAAVTSFKFLKKLKGTYYQWS